MTIPAHAELIHAFADGKTLQYEQLPGEWETWTFGHCPDFALDKWRIKPTPKVTRYLAWQGTSGCLAMCLEGSELDESYRFYKDQWKRIPALDKEVTEDE